MQNLMLFRLVAFLESFEHSPKSYSRIHIFSSKVNNIWDHLLTSSEVVGLTWKIDLGVDFFVQGVSVHRPPIKSQLWVILSEKNHSAGLGNLPGTVEARDKKCVFDFFGPNPCCLEGMRAVIQWDFVSIWKVLVSGSLLDGPCQLLLPLRSRKYCLHVIYCVRRAGEHFARSFRLENGCWTSWTGPDCQIPGIRSVQMGEGLRSGNRNSLPKRPQDYDCGEETVFILAKTYFIVKIHYSTSFWDT